MTQQQQRSTSGWQPRPPRRMPLNLESPSPGVIALALAAAVAGLILIVGGCGSLERTNGGEYAVVRNGGPLDDRAVRQVLMPGSSLTWTGLWSSSHKYPAQQRFYTITSNAAGGDLPGADVETPTSDGVQVGIEGTLYFNLKGDEALLKEFDNRFGTRQFGNFYPYEGNDGFRAFLNAVVRPVIENNLRKQIAAFECSELVSSCALVKNQGRASPRALEGNQNNENLERIQQAINTGLVRDVRSTLGGDFLENLRFNLVRVRLPARVDRAVGEAQAAFAEVTKSQARVASAKADAAANRQRQRGLEFPRFRGHRL
jgi:regulator of protease activity HflC (stomatin/prohibitin superfamily)